MKKTFLFLFSMVTLTATSQHCGTMDVLNQLYSRNPELRGLQDSLNREDQRKIIEAYPWIVPSKGTFPKLPGFVETGNREKDLQNYGIAKRALIATNPDEFYRLTRTKSDKSSR